MWRMLLVALLSSGCVTARPPRVMTWNWPAETTRVGTYLHETRFVDGDGERTTRGSASFAEKISTAADGSRSVETFDVLVMNGDPVFRTIARLLEGTVTLDANGALVKFEREKTATGPGVKSGNQTLVEKMAPMVNQQLEDDARVRWRELLGLWRGRTFEGPSASWRMPSPNGNELIVEVREARCRVDQPAQCVRIHARTEDAKPEGAEALFHTMAHQPASFASADERREFILVTDPATLLPMSFTSTVVTTLRGTIAGQDATFVEAHHSELNWQ